MTGTNCTTQLTWTKCCPDSRGNSGPSAHQQDSDRAWGPSPPSSTSHRCPPSCQPAACQTMLPGPVRHSLCPFSVWLSLWPHADHSTQVPEINVYKMTPWVQEQTFSPREDRGPMGRNDQGFLLWFFFFLSLWEYHLSFSLIPWEPVDLPSYCHSVFGLTQFIIMIGLLFNTAWL